MPNKASRAVWIRGIAALVVLVLTAAALLFSRVLSDKAKEAAGSAAPTNLSETEQKFLPHLRFVMNQLSLQQDVDQSILTEVASGAYSLDQPLVVVNPYEISPLTAIVAFQTQEPARVSVHIPGVDALTDIDFTFEDDSTEHIVPIYGLYAGTTNSITLHVVFESGAEQSVTIPIETESLPQRLENIALIADVVQPDQVQPGLNFMYERKAAFDANGTFRWFLNGDFRSPTHYEYNGGHFIVVLGATYEESPVMFLEINPLGRIFKVLYAPYACHHDIEPYGADAILVSGSRGETVEDFLYEINTTTGEVVNTLDLKTIFPRVREGLMKPDVPDWLHINDMTLVDDGGDILISSRHQSFVARISWPEGRIKWILSVHEHWPEMFQKYLLTPIGDEFEWQYNQHAPYILPDQDQNPDTMDVLVYDNGNARLGTDGVDSKGLYTRIVHYQIDEANMTVRQVWQYGKELGEDLYANSRGNVVPVENGNLVAPYCMQLGETYSVDYREIDKNSQLVWQVIACSKLKTGKLIEYRMSRLPIYNANANAIQWDAEAINLIPTEVLTRYGFH